jgi:GNAT superfamily N-acetyltransferase
MGGFFMLDQEKINGFVLHLKKTKYKNKIQELIIEYCTNDNNENYLQLFLIKIKDSQKNKGYGSAIISDIVQFADEYNVQIKLWTSNIYGGDLKRLFEFYKKNGFVLIKTPDKNNMIYYPSKIRKNKKKLEQ